MDENTQKAVREMPVLISTMNELREIATGEASFIFAIAHSYNYGYICGKRDERERQKRKRTGQQGVPAPAKTTDPVHQHMVDFIRKWAVEQDEKNVAIAYHFIKHCKGKGGAL